MQTQDPASLTRITSMTDGLRQVVRAEGARGLFRGVVPRSLTLGLSTGVMMACYAELKHRVQGRST